MNPLAERVRHLLYGWCTVGIIYGACGLVQGPGTTLPETVLDRAIAFSSSGIWGYLSFFVLVPVTFLCGDLRRLGWLQLAFQTSALVSGAIFLLWPTTLHYPPITGMSSVSDLHRTLNSLDSRQNCLPSLHGALTLLCIWALADARRLLRSILIAAWGIGILYATIQTRRHMAIDLAGGLATGAICGTAVRLCLDMRASALETRRNYV